MKIVADENIVYTNHFFADNTNHTLILKSGRDICQQDLQDADVLLVRSVTQVNEQLLNNTPIKFVGTATIGTDHIDKNYLAQHQIRFADASGCSADTVAQYVICAIYHLKPEYINHPSFTPNCKPKLGIVGYGNIGKALAKIASQLGWQVLICDPFVNSKIYQNVDLNALVQQVDMVSLHVPLTYPLDLKSVSSASKTISRKASKTTASKKLSGSNTTAKTGSSHPTHHLINQAILDAMPADTLLINTARGKVICEADLLADMAKTQRQVVLDVFEHEPMVSAKLIKALALATPHIAGYSLEGKARGTQFIYEAFCQWQNKTPNKHINQLLPTEKPLFSRKNNQLNQGSLSLNTQLSQNLANIYTIADDDRALRQMVLSTINDKTQAFDELRKNYRLRREWHAYGL